MPAKVTCQDWGWNREDSPRLLAFGLGFGDVYFHQARIGRIIGQEQEVWNGFINWRIMRTVKEAQAMGTDQLREVIKQPRQRRRPLPQPQATGSDARWLAGAIADDEIRDPILTLRFHNFCVEDEVTALFNGKALTIERKNIHEPRRGTFWLSWRLEAIDFVEGDNSAEIEIVRREKTAGFARTPNGVEIHIRYTEFDRPEALDPIEIPPPA